MKQIDKLREALVEIGFVIQANESVLQIIGLSEKKEDKLTTNIKAYDNIEFEKVSHVLQVVIELDDPTSEIQKYLFQDCSLKVYFEDWNLQEVAKIIKLNIANVLNEHGIFRGMNFEFPKDHNEVVVP
jgi:hypothetical protein